MNADITIDPEFQTMIPPLDGKTLAQLEENLVEAGGAREPLVVWKVDGKRILLDGHNRLAICTQKNLFYTVEEIQVADREAAKDWIDRNQIGRRNMTPEQMALLLGRRYNRTKKEKGAPTGNSNRSNQMVQNAPFERSSATLAKEHGVHEQTIRRAGQFAQAVEKLGIEKEIVSNLIDAPRKRIIEAAETLPDAPTPEQVKEVVKAVKEDRPIPGNPDPPKPIMTKAELKALPPMLGYHQAQRAIRVLEQIDKRDGERKRGFQLVRGWLDENE